MATQRVVDEKNVETDAGSQTLARGLRALEIVAAAAEPISVVALTQQLGIHRSMGYRLVKTLEQHGFIERRSAGGYVIGTKMSTLARGVAKSLQAAATPQLRVVAELLDMTAFLVTYDGEAAVTLGSVEPQKADTTVAIRPGSRHAIGQGAPGKVIRSQLTPERYPQKRFEVSQEEVLPGIASLAVPLIVSGEPPAALAVLFLPHEVNAEHIADVLETAAQRIVAALP